MLKAVSIKGFRSCRDVEIRDLLETTVLLGRNAAGKTNLMRAIDWTARVASGATHENALAQFHRHVDLSSEIRISVMVELKKKLFTYDLSYGFTGYPTKEPYQFIFSEMVSVKTGNTIKTICTRNDDEIAFGTLGKRDTIKIGRSISCLTALESVLPESSAVSKQIKPLLEYFRSVRYYPLDEPNVTDQMYYATYVTEDDYDKWFAQYKQGAAPGQSVLMRIIHMHLHGRLKELEDTLGQNGLKLIRKMHVRSVVLSDEQEGKQAKPGNSLYFVSFLPFTESRPKGTRNLTYAQLSCGTRRILRMIVSLIFDCNSTMLLEHPEDGVHTGLVKKLVSTLKENSGTTQIVMSSHSLTLLNAFEPEEIRLVTIEDGKTKVRALTPHELKAANKFIGENGGNLADFYETVERSEE